jgi:hypothetical protein
MPYTPLPEHTLDEPILSNNICKTWLLLLQLPTSCKIHTPKIEFHIKCKDPETNKSKLLKFPKLAVDLLSLALLEYRAS